uniref:Uncharacterized protein n=1 Tax=Anguilla anguilla TaxID=7936 RepID=A0A0E9P6I6_ANGAN
MLSCAILLIIDTLRCHVQGFIVTSFN